VSLRVRARTGEAWTVARYETAGRRDEGWIEEDDEQFGKLERARRTLQTSVLDFDVGTTRAMHSVLAMPVASGEAGGDFWGGVIAYDKRPATAVEEAAFSAHDESVVAQVIAMALPAVKSLSASDRSARPPYDEMLAGNVQRLARITEAEMTRADRYHHSFSLLLVRVPALGDLFQENETKACGLADEIRQGFQTRTRGSDFGCWVKRDTYAMLTLEGTRRIKFLVSRLVTYLIKDLAAGGIQKSAGDVWIGASHYPGTARSPDALLQEAERALKPHAGE
jgi:hypothetical protein